MIDLILYAAMLYFGFIVVIAVLNWSYQATRALGRQLRNDWGKVRRVIHEITTDRKLNTAALVFVWCFILLLLGIALTQS